MNTLPTKGVASNELLRFASSSSGVDAAVVHSLFWLVVGNAIGVWIAVVLLVPGLNSLVGEWTYGRWIMVHLNVALYGWCSLPMLAFLFCAYRTEESVAARWAHPAVWAWSFALALGSFSWLSGHSSGKLFLDWSGVARVYFPLAMLSLWCVLALSLMNAWRMEAKATRIAKVGGLVLLFAVPALIFFASSPGVYPAFNPDTGGPTGASQLESSLVVIAILLLLPYGLTKRKTETSWVIPLSWALLVAEAALCAALGRQDISHHRPAQFLSLASLLLWIPLTPAYYAAFAWHAAARRWRNACLWWWAVLVVSGWVLFLPGVLDHFKFTDGLVGHSLTALAGFVTALLLFVMAQLLGDDAWIFNGTLSFYAWNFGVLSYVASMTIAGWLEGSNPAFTIVPGLTRNVLYLLRMLTGTAMLAASVDWFRRALQISRDRRAVHAQLYGGSILTLEKTA